MPSLVLARRFFKAWVLSIFFLNLCCPSATAETGTSSSRERDEITGSQPPETFQSSDSKTELLELFTSEGCSSCPPADLWIGHLQSQSGLWKDFVPVAFHVSYWDYLGWIDRMARGEHTARQRAYAASWNQRTLYTPALVLNGSPWQEWHRSKTVPDVSQEDAGVLRVAVLEENRYRVQFNPSSAEPQKWQAHLALLGFGIDSRIMAGENRGKALQHHFVVLDYQSRALESAETGTSPAPMCRYCASRTGRPCTHQQVPAVRRAEGPPLPSLLKALAFSERVEIKGSRPEETPLVAKILLKMPEAISSERYGVAAWITRGKEMTPVQATGGYLKSEGKK